MVTPHTLKFFLRDIRDTRDIRDFRDETVLLTADYTNNNYVGKYINRNLTQLSK
jgi:hypothetical protein